MSCAEIDLLKICAMREHAVRVASLSRVVLLKLPHAIQFFKDQWHKTCRAIEQVCSRSSRWARKPHLKQDDAQREDLCRKEMHWLIEQLHRRLHASAYQCSCITHGQQDRV